MSWAVCQVLHRIRLATKSVINAASRSFRLNARTNSALMMAAANQSGREKPVVCMERRAAVGSRGGMLRAAGMGCWFCVRWLRHRV